MRKWLAFGLLVAAGTVSGCTTKNAWSHYDECSGSGSFVAMADCGKKARTVSCAAASNCSAEGDTIVLYVDSLKRSVEKAEMSDAEATRRWLEYRNATRQRLATEVASAPSTVATPGPFTCHTVAGITNCY